MKILAFMCKGMLFAGLVILSMESVWAAIDETESGVVDDETIKINKLSPWYLGAKVGSNHFSRACDEQNTDCDASGTAGGIFLGYQLNDWLSIEGGYDYLGKVKAIYPALEDPAKTVNYEATVQGLELGLKADYYLLDNIVLFAKAGMLGWHTETEGQELSYAVSDSDNGVSPMLGGGVEYHLTKRWTSRLEYQWFESVGESDTGGADSHLVTLGLIYKFGVTEPTPVVQQPIPQIVYAEPVIIEKRIEILSENNGKEMFQFNSDKLSVTMMESLQPMLKRLLSYPQAKLAIVGHTDTTGPQVYNQKLSEKRAKNFLISHKAPPMLKASLA